MQNTNAIVIKNVIVMLAAVAIVLTTLMVSGCSGDDATPEGQERFVLAEAMPQVIAASPRGNIIVDQQTGVNYLLVTQGQQAVAVTPLLDESGKVVVTPVE